MDRLAGFDSLPEQSVQNAHFFHDIAQALDAFFVAELGTGGELFYLRAGDQETIVCLRDSPRNRIVFQPENRQRFFFCGFLVGGSLALCDDNCPDSKH